MTRIEKACVDKGLRMTDQRRVIARVLSDAADHPDAEELYRRASAIDNWGASITSVLANQSGKPRRPKTIGR